MKKQSEVNEFLNNLSKKYEEISLEVETFSYRYSSDLDEFGDYVVEDVSSKSTVKLKVPHISFSDVLDVILHMNKNGIPYKHYYKNYKDHIDPNIYDPHAPEGLWKYFDHVDGNSLKTYHNSAKNTFICIYFLPEFNTFMVLGFE